MNKSISRAIGGPITRVTTAMVALAVVLLLVLSVVAVAKTTSTIDERAASPAKHAMSSDGGTGGIVNQHSPATVTPTWSLATTQTAFANRSDGEQEYRVGAVLQERRRSGKSPLHGPPVAVKLAPTSREARENGSVLVTRAEHRP